MSADRRDLTNPQRRLPDLTFPDKPAGEAIPLRTRERRATLLILVHGGVCPACGDFVREVAAARETLEEWDGRPLLVSPDATTESADFPGRGDFPLLYDPEERLRADLDLTPPAVVVADQWGEVHEIWAAGEKHDFPALAGIIGSLRYLAIRCPECEGESL